MGFIGALVLAAQPMRGTRQPVHKVQEGLAAVERIYEIIDEQPGIVDRPGAQPLRLDRIDPVRRRIVQLWRQM